MDAKNTLEPGVIHRDAAYAQEPFGKLVGLGRDGLAAAKRNGLRTIKKHNRCYILGKDWFDYLDRIGSDQDQQA